MTDHVAAHSDNDDDHHHVVDETQLPAETAATSIATHSSGPATTTTTTTSDKTTIAKLSAQLKRLNDANVKYKNLLKLAKERIEKQEEEMNKLQQENAQLSERVLELEEKEALWTLNSRSLNGNGSNNNDEIGDGSSRHNNNASSGGVESSSIVRICQRTQQKLNDGTSEIWALVEMQTTYEDGGSSSSDGRRYKEWKRFDTEAQLQDYIRLETGEPIVLPPYALSQEQSQRIQEEAEQQIMKISDEFRRFRVKAELARKQSESLIREMQASLTQQVAQRSQNKSEDSVKNVPNINGHMSESEQVRALSKQLEQVTKAMATQEAEWKQSHQALADEWRTRYEQCWKEKVDLENRTKRSSAPTAGDADYEAKYKDLKGSNPMKRSIDSYLLFPNTTFSRRCIDRLFVTF